MELKPETIKKIEEKVYDVSWHYMNVKNNDVQGLHNVIAELLEVRSMLLHIVTSDVTSDIKLPIRAKLSQVEDWIINCMASLPDNHPDWPTTLQVGGKILRLQSLRGETARYVPLAEYREDDFAYEPIDPVKALEDRIARSIEIMAEIRALEAEKLDPVNYAGEPIGQAIA